MIQNYKINISKNPVLSHIIMRYYFEDANWLKSRLYIL